MIALFRLLYGAAVDFRRHGCSSLAASLAFFALLSFFPIVFLLLYIIGFFVSQDRIGYDFLLNFLQGFLPTLGADLAAEVKRVAGEQIVRWVVFLAFVWFGMLVFHEVDYAINVVFESPRKRHPLISTAISIALLGLVEGLMILSYLVTQVLRLLVDYAPRIGGIDLVAIAAHKFLLSYVLPFALVLAAVTCLYRYLPTKRPAWREAAVGGVVLALLWEFAKHLFSTYVQHLSVYGRMYGSLLMVVLFLLWVYYSAALLLFGAGIVHRLQAKR
ncbi:MAG: YihY/virulence factor BrkB family protein [Nitrospirae bacterium]|nr:MAG: YihY/virulence factor BrkB family protein [Nitrospirota bacterium]